MNQQIDFARVVNAEADRGSLQLLQSATRQTSTAERLTLPRRNPRADPRPGAFTGSSPERTDPLRGSGYMRAVPGSPSRRLGTLRRRHAAFCDKVGKEDPIA